MRVVGTRGTQPLLLSDVTRPPPSLFLFAVSATTCTALPNVHGPSIPPQIYSTNYSVKTRGSPVLCPRSHSNATLKFAHAPLLIGSEQKRRGRHTNWYCCTDYRHPVSFYPKKTRHKLVQPTEGVPSTPLLLGSESKNKNFQSRNLPPPAVQPSTHPQLTRASVAQTQSINGPYTSSKIGPRSKASNKTHSTLLSQSPPPLPGH